MTGSQPSNGAALREVLTVYAVSVVVCSGLFFSQYFSPFIYGLSAELAAMLFIFLPIWVLDRQRIPLERVGIAATHLRLNVSAFLLLSLLIFPLYAIGFHGYQRLVSKARLQPRAQSYRLFPRTLERQPFLRDDGSVRVWSGYAELFIYWEGKPSDRHLIEISGDVPLSAPRYLVKRDDRLRKTARRPAALSVQLAGKRLTVSSASGIGGIAVNIDRNNLLRWRVLRNGELLPGSQLRLGRSSAAGENPMQVERSYGWLWLFLLTQLVLVALPEELFYRGYIQSKLNGVFQKRWRFLGADLGWAVLVTSLLFALGHFFVDWNPARLAVFFPSLAFGWLRERTSTIGASIGFHWMCNVIAELLGRVYMIGS